MGRKDKTGSYTFNLLPGTDVALFHWTGPITLEDRIRNLDRMVDFCEANDVFKLVIDGRDQESLTGTLENYDFGAQVPKAFRRLRVAVVHRQDDDSLHFIETVAFNRGAGTHAFTDFDEALHWLETVIQDDASDDT